jgi:hypothetical protein
MKMEVENMENMSFREASQTMYPWPRSLEILWVTEQCALEAMKMSRKYQK